jgi:hypothetical protein
MISDQNASTGGKSPVANVSYAFAPLSGVPSTGNAE